MYGISPPPPPQKKGGGSSLSNAPAVYPLSLPWQFTDPLKNGKKYALIGPLLFRDVVYKVALKVDPSVACQLKKEAMLPCPGLDKLILNLVARPLNLVVQPFEMCKPSLNTFKGGVAGGGGGIQYIYAHVLLFSFTTVTVTATPLFQKLRTYLMEVQQKPTWANIFQ